MQLSGRAISARQRSLAEEKRRTAVFCNQDIFGGIAGHLEPIHRAHRRGTFSKGALRAPAMALKQEAGTLQ